MNVGHSARRKTCSGCGHSIAAAVIAGLLLTASATRAGDWYVNVTGDDANDCLSPATACRNLFEAIFRSAAGDTIHVAAGRYVENSVVPSGADLRIAGEARATTILDGGAANVVLLVMDAATLTLSALTLTNGSNFNDGGGVVNRGTLTMTDCAVEGNRGFNGGGILNDQGSLTIRRSTVRDNEATGGGGGGILNDGTLDLSDSTVDGNRAYNAGALLASSGTARLTNCTLSGNVVGFASGAMFVNSGAGVVIASCTIAGNTAVVGPGGVVNRSGNTVPVVLRHTILAGNVSSSSNGIDCEGEIVSEGYNLIGDVTGCTILGDLSGNQLAVDPLLGSIQDNGGPTYTRALLAGSPAIDAGNPAGCTAADGAPLTADQRGEPRPADCGAGVRCDIGAFELQCVPAGPTLYESSDPSQPGNPVGRMAASPYDHAPGAGDTLFYRADDGTGSPALIRLVRGGRGLLVHF